jgi:hypothetical protein
MCVTACCKATATAALPALSSPVPYASNTGHAAAVILCRLVNACLSRIANDKQDQVIHYSCYMTYERMYKSGLESFCMLCGKQSCWSHPPCICLKPYAYPVGRNLYECKCQASCSSDSVHLWTCVCDSLLHSHSSSRIASAGQSRSFTHNIGHAAAVI